MSKKKVLIHFHWIDGFQKPFMQTQVCDGYDEVVEFLDSNVGMTFTATVERIKR